MKIFFPTRQEMRTFTKTAPAFKNSAAKEIGKTRGGQWAAVRKTHEVQGKFKFSGAK
jgi:hypothetical protein